MNDLITTTKLLLVLSAFSSHSGSILGFQSPSLTYAALSWYS
jgi:hypothetical protein